MTVEHHSGPIDVEELANGLFVWAWTSPGGACHQGPKHYKRRSDALRAGQLWLAKLLENAASLR
jgi:hypothetical protein